MHLRQTLIVLTLLLTVYAAGASSHEPPEAKNDEELIGFIRDHPAVLRPAAELALSSNMQDLVVTWYDLPRDDGTGGGLAEVAGVLLSVGGHGEIHWLSLDYQAGPYRVDSRVPMNLDLLDSSGLEEIEPRFNRRWVRVAGVYAEEVGQRLDLYVSHHFYEIGCFYFKVSKLSLAFHRSSGLQPVDTWQQIFLPLPCIRPGEGATHPFAGNQAGGRIVSLDGEHLLVAVGDHRLDGQRGTNAPQDPALPYGKIWKIAKDGSEASIYVSGLRNPQGLVQDRDGRVWATEHGPRGGDELNLIEFGANYGWPFQTYGIDYGGDWPLNAEQGSHADPRFRAPAFAWVPSVAISAVAQIGGPRFARWQGDLVAGTLKDMSLRRLRLNGDAIAYDERIEVGMRIRDIISLKDGRLALLTDGHRLGILDEPGRVAPKPAGGLPLEGVCIAAGARPALLYQSPTAPEVQPASKVITGQ